MSKIFGALPSGERLSRVKSSPQYKAGKFSNQSLTPDLTEDANMWKLLKAFRQKPRTTKPNQPIPALVPDFRSIPATAAALIWLGHSSYYLQIEGVKVLVDPVLSGRASPMPGMVKAFEGTDIVRPDDFPALDYVLITHDHYDHLDYHTVLELKSRTKHWITSLGAAAHLEYWGIPREAITELDWWDHAALINNCSITATPARHFSGRGLKRAQSLWSSFVFQSPRHTLFLGGDSGWDVHFRTIGKRFGPFDLAILECGQYHSYWKHIHMMPEEVADAAEQLGAKYLLPVHWAKFSLSLHPWDEPIERLLKAAVGKPFELLTPQIGSTVQLFSGLHYNQTWWRSPRA